MRRILIYILTFCFAPALVSAQTEQVIVPGDLKQQTIISEPATLRKGYVRAGIEAGFIIIDKTFDEEGNRNYILGTNAWGKYTGVQLALHYGITDRFEAGIKIPYVNNQYLISTLLRDVTSGTDSLISFRSRGRGLGDIEAGLKYQLILETDKIPSITVGTVVLFPTGEKNPTNIINDLQYDIPTGGGHYEWEVFLMARKVMYPYSVQIRMHYEHYFPGEKIFHPDEPEIEFKNGDMFIIAGRFDLHLNDWIALSNEIHLQTFADNTYYYDPVETSPTGWGLDYVPSLHFQIRKFRFQQGIFIPLAGKYLAADPIYALGLSYIF